MRTLRNDDTDAANITFNFWNKSKNESRTRYGRQLKMADQCRKRNRQTRCVTLSAVLSTSSAR
jgi:hypothetical protein